MSSLRAALFSTFATLGCLAGLAAAAPAAHACSPLQSMFWNSLGEVSPRAGAVDVPLDAPLVFQLNRFEAQQAAHPKGQAPERGQGLAAYGVTLKVTDAGSGQEIAGVARSHGWNGLAFAWQPTAPWQPGTRVKAVLGVDNLSVRPADGQGPLEGSVEFTVGGSALPPLTSEGAPQVVLESYTAPVVEACGCGPCESQTTTTTALRARIVAPAVTGGFAAIPYNMRTFVTRDVPYDFAFNPGQAAAIVADYRVIPAGERPEIVLRLPDDPTLSTVCIASEAEDARGKKLASPPVCLAAKRSALAEEPGGCNMGTAGEPLAPLLLILAFASWAAFLILRRAHRP